MRRLWCLVMLLGPWPLLAQAGLAAGSDPTLDLLRKLLDTPIQVASGMPMRARETPGIITVLERSDLQASGARDLLEALRFVPGLDFASDTQGVVGIGVRTSWGHDGKVLLLVDGQEMNEPLYGTLQFGGHYPVDNIQRIEVIRGPGSVIYGGYAELAVINVVTRKGAAIQGVEGSFWLGRMAAANSPLAHGHLSYGQSWGEYELALAYTRGHGPQGAGIWRLDPSAGDREVQAGDLSELNQDFLNLNASGKGLNLHYMRDAYSLKDYTGEAKTTPWTLAFPAEFLGLDYQFALGDWSFQPKFSIKAQTPWVYSEARSDRNTRTTGALLGTWARRQDLKVTLGLEASQDHSNIFWSSRGVREVFIYENRAYLIQTVWSPGVGNLDLGLRYDRHSSFGNALSPRLAFTRAEADWHFKGLAAGAFRAPSIENLLVNPNLVPERTLTYEVEAGHTLGPTTYLSANAFYLRVHNPIAYGNPAPGVNGYFNFDHTGARGIEVSLRSLGKSFNLLGTLSLSKADDRQADFYRVEGHPAFHVGFSNLKASTQVQWRFHPGWSLNPGVLLLGPRYGYRYGEPQPTRFGTTTLVNVVLTHTWSQQLEASLNVTNLTNARDVYIQAYGVPGVGGNPPLPGPGRGVDGRVSFHF